MSLMKWTLAMVGTAFGLHYMADRQRRRIANGGSPAATTCCDARSAADSPWPVPQTGGGITSGMGSSPAAESSIAGSGLAAVSHDDLLAPDSGLAPGNSSSRL